MELFNWKRERSTVQIIHSRYSIDSIAFDIIYLTLTSQNALFLEGVKELTVCVINEISNAFPMRFCQTMTQSS